MKYQFNLGNDEFVAIDKDKLEEFTTNNPNAKFNDFVNDDTVGKTDPSPEKKDALVKENKIASDTGSTSGDGSSDSIENQTENNCPDGQVKGADGKCYDPKAENEEKNITSKGWSKDVPPVGEKVKASSSENGLSEPKKVDNVALYKNYQDAVEVEDEEIKERFFRDYFELYKLNMMI